MRIQKYLHGQRMQRPFYQRSISVKKCYGQDTRDGTQKVLQLRKVPYAEYCFSDREGKHLRIAGPCIISTNNDDKLKLYEAIPILKKYYKDPSDPKFVVIRMKPERIRFLAGTGKGYEDIELPK